MGLLDGLISGALGGLLQGAQSGAAAAPGQPPLGGASPYLQIALQLIQQSGGLPALLERFRGAGLGQHVDSWVATGQNMPVSGHEVTQALGPDVVNNLAQQAGVDPSHLSNGLSQILPEIINQMTPDGQVPDNHHDLLAEGLQILLGRR